jgi:ribosomal protein L15
MTLKSAADTQPPSDKYDVAVSKRAWARCRSLYREIRWNRAAGRGYKGQKARNGRNPRLGFEGGQTPLRLRIPKRGFTNVFGHSFQEVNLGTIAEFVKQGRIDASQLITMKTLKVCVS